MADIKMLKEMIADFVDMGVNEDTYVVMRDANNYDVIHPFNGMHIDRVEKDGQIVKALVLTPYVPIKK